MWIKWTGRVWLVLGHAAALSFTISVALLHRLFLTKPALQIGLRQLGASTQEFMLPVVAAATTTSVVHLLTIVEHDNRVQCLVKVQRRDHALFMLWEVVLQTFQAYKISYLVPSVSLNRLVALVIVTNCCFSPILHYVMGSRPVAHVRLGRLMVDCCLDLIYSTLVPLAIFYPYYRDFDGSVTLYPVVFYYDDTWYVNAISELRQLFVTSWLDFVSKGSASVSLVYRLWKVKTALDDVSLIDNRTKQNLSSGPAERQRVASLAEPKQWHRNRLTRLLDLVLVLRGATIISLHLATSITAFRFHDPDCLLEMRPWGSLAYSCASFEISCSKRHETGDRETMEAILRTVDPLSVQNLILSNCAQLHLPPAIQKLQYLTMIKIYNSTIASWDTQAALRQAYHPQLQVIYFARVNVSGFPEGMLVDDFPSSVWDIEFCMTNVSSFPPAITTAWTHVGIVVYEGNPDVTEYPHVLTTLPSMFVLHLSMNNIQAIDDDIFKTQKVAGISMNGNPVELLPQHLGNIDHLIFLNFVETKIATVPLAWMDIAPPDTNACGTTVLSAAGSPLCELDNAQTVTKPAWLAINCDTPPSGLYAYPIEQEDAWRSKNL